MSKTSYTVKTNLGADGVGEMWNFEQAQAHVTRCEYTAHGIEYEIVEHTEEDIDQLQPTESKRGRRKSSREGTDE